MAYIQLIKHNGWPLLVDVDIFASGWLYSGQNIKCEAAFYCVRLLVLVQYCLLLLAMAVQGSGEKKAFLISSYLRSFTWRCQELSQGPSACKVGSVSLTLSLSP